MSIQIKTAQQRHDQPEDPYAQSRRFVNNKLPDIFAMLARELWVASSGDAALLTDLLDAATLIRSNVLRAARLISTFKTLSVRNVTDFKEEVDLGELTREAVGLYRLKARQSRLKLEVEDNLGPSGRAWEGYPGHFTQVILNLLTNIDRYAYPEGEGGTVRVAVGRNGQGGTKPHFAVVVEDFL